MTSIRLVARTYPISVIVGSETERTTLLMHWSEEDPAAVNLTVEDPWSRGAEAVIVEWIVSRAVLVAACLPNFRDVEVGLHGVKVRHRGATATIRLASHEGSCVLAVRGEVLLDFLRGVAAQMPLGCDEESEIYGAQIDREWTEMAAGGAG